MTTPIDTLYAAAKERQERGVKVMSIEFVLDMIEREDKFYRLPSKSPLEPFGGVHRQSV